VTTTGPRATDGSRARAPLPLLVSALTLALLLFALPTAAELALSSGLQRVHPVEVLKAVRTGEGPVIIDARGANEYAAGHIPGAINVPYKEIWGRIQELRAYEERGIVFYCAEGVRAKIAGEALLVEGFRRVGALDGSLRAWRQAGLPVEYNVANPPGGPDE